MTQREQAQLLSTGLTGIGRQLWKGYKTSRGRECSPNGLLRTLRQVCKTPRQPATRVLHNIEQGENETLTHFGVRVITAVRSLSDRQSAREVDRNAIGYLTAGAHEHIQAALQLRRPHTFEQAMKFGREAEAEELVRSKNSKKNRKAHEDRFETRFNDLLQQLGAHRTPTPAAPPLAPPPQQAQQRALPNRRVQLPH